MTCACAAYVHGRELQAHCTRGADHASHQTVGDQRAVMGVQRPVHDVEVGHELVDPAVVEAGPRRGAVRCPMGSADEPLTDVRALQSVRFVGVETCPPFEHRRRARGGLLRGSRRAPRTRRRPESRPRAARRGTRSIPARRERHAPRWRPRTVSVISGVTNGLPSRSPPTQVPKRNGLPFVGSWAPRRRSWTERSSSRSGTTSWASSSR